MSALLKEEAVTRLSRQGNSTGLTLSSEVMRAVGFSRGDSVKLTADRTAGTITVRKADDTYSQAMEVGRAFAARYRRTMAALAK